MKAFWIFVLLSFTSGFCLAQLAQDEKEKQFELEEETVQIHDLEAERKAAKEEAQNQEKQEKATKKELQHLQVQKEREAELTKKQVAGFRERILTAEKKRKSYEVESARLTKEVEKLKAKVAEHEAKAKSSAVAASDASKIVNDLKHEKLEMTKRETLAIRQTSTAEGQITSLKLQYARLKMETQQLEGHLKMIEQVEAKKEADRENRQREVTSMKDRRKAAQDAIRAHPGHQ